MANNKASDDFFDQNMSADNAYQYDSPNYEGNDQTNEFPEDPVERARQEQILKEELIKLEEEINALQEVLHVKVRQAADIKRKLGISALTEFKDDMRHGLQTIKESNAYQKTSETLVGVGERISTSNAYQKTSAAVKVAGDKTTTALSTAGAYATRKLGDIRNSNLFKSMEEKVGGAYSSVKTRVANGKSESFDESVQQETDSHSEDIKYPNPTTTADYTK